MSKVLIISGSARNTGNTYKTVQEITRGYDCNVAQLANLNINHYDYDYKNQSDDFYDISNIMLASQKIVFATPVYWYSMSAHMKIFFDRLSDLLDIRKQDGKRLAKKKIYLLANGKTDNTLPDGFEVPFEKTANYFDMIYEGKCFVKFNQNDEIDYNISDKIEAFAGRIFND